MTKPTPPTPTSALTDALDIGALDTLPRRANEALAAREHMHKNERDRLDTARHEAAHLVAAWAMGAFVDTVHINQSISPTRLPLGRVRAGCVLQREEAFVACAGIAWEDTYGHARHAAADLRYAESQMAELGEDLGSVLPFTRDFIANADTLINQLAVALYSWAQSNPTGQVARTKLHRLRSWGEPQIPAFRGAAFVCSAVAALPRSLLPALPPTPRNLDIEAMMAELDKVLAKI